MRFIVRMVLIAFVLALMSCYFQTDVSTRASEWDESLEADALAVEALTVGMGKLTDQILSAGIIHGKNEINIVSETQGILTNVQFELGDFVKAGYDLAQVDDTIAAVSVRQSYDQYKNAQIDRETTEKLYNDGRSSLSELYRARAAENGALSAYESALKVLNSTKMKTPISGFVASKGPGVSQGNYVNPGQIIARVVDLDDFRVEIAVGENEIGLISEGDQALVSIPAVCPDGMAGEVVAIAAGSDDLSGSFAVIVAGSNTCGDKLRSGMTAIVSILVSSHNQVIIIPTSALVMRDRTNGVFIDKNGEAVFVPVQTGSKMGNRIEVLQGLSEDDILINSGLTKVNNGEKVKTTIIGETGGWS